MGAFADVPWVAVMHEDLGGNAGDGYYLVYLFAKDLKRIYLTLGVGAGCAHVKEWTKSARERTVARSAVLRRACAGLSAKGFRLDDDLDLASDNLRPQSYVSATAAYIGYDADRLPAEDRLEADFTHAYGCFSGLIRSGFRLTEDSGAQASHRCSGLRGGIPAGPLSPALLAKPFVILTGPSGTGKTRGALRLAECLCLPEERELVAVGADWTDNRHVTGFLNPLEKAGELPVYEATPILRLLLRANRTPDRPHVLILDEMNLSQVERYFADFLSAMELEDGRNALKLHSAGRAVTREGLEVPGGIDFPTNLFVIGTVNIDETTHMFSPKVLDRANVLEILPDAEALDRFLRGGAAAGGEEKEGDFGISFLDLAREIRRERESDPRVPPLPDGVREMAAGRLMELFRILRRGRAEFGFRCGREIMAYLRAVHFLTAEPARTAWCSEKGGWLEALDSQILQKILPKLHGGRTRLAPLLGALATYCAGGGEQEAMGHFPEDGALPKRGLKDISGSGNAMFPASHRKLRRMAETLVEEQFASFIC